VIRRYERQLAHDPGPLLESWGGDDDRLWPADRWPATRLDGPLQVGTTGGHGPVRYEVAEYEPGRRLVFDLRAPRGLDGRLLFEADGNVLRHVIEADLHGAMKIAWPLVLQPIHDALIGDLLDRAAGTPPRPFSLRVRLFRRLLTARRPSRAASA
jgi:hypothetical protein